MAWSGWECPLCGSLSGGWGHLAAQALRGRHSTSFWGLVSLIGSRGIRDLKQSSEVCLVQSRGGRKPRAEGEGAGAVCWRGSPASQRLRSSPGPGPLSLGPVSLASKFQGSRGAIDASQAFLVLHLLLSRARAPGPQSSGSQNPLCGSCWLVIQLGLWVQESRTVVSARVLGFSGTDRPPPSETAGRLQRRVQVNSYPSVLRSLWRKRSPLHQSLNLRYPKRK